MNSTTDGLVQLWNEWEIQLVVLLSFILQIFLFFTGRIRRCNINMLLRLIIWLAYVGADMVAVYALGLISQNVQSVNISSVGFSRSSNQLAFFWVPFLLIHLGGQDTMTAFSIKDNNLWLRHLLNLCIQVFLALYAFWKSTGRHNLQLLAPAILMFHTGIIRYGERTWALKCGSRNGLRETSWQLPKLNVEVDKGSYIDTICYVLQSILCVHDLFSGRTISQMKERQVFRFQGDRPLEQVPKLLEIELAMMSDDLYTKAMVLQTRSGIILRSSSKMFTILRKMLNAVNKKLWFRKIWHIKHVKVDKDIMDIMVTWVGRLAREEFTRITQQQSWANLRPIINCTLNIPANSFGDNIVLLHIYTDLHLRKQPDNEATGAESETASSSTADIMDICRKISNYIVYLLVAQPSMLPLSGAADDTTAAFYEKISKKGSSKQDVLETCYQLVEDQLEFGYEECLKEQEQPGPWCETLMEIRDMWLRLLIYIAGKCQVELHAQQLGRGGELLTFVWLLMAHHDIGDVAHQVDLITSSETMSRQFCAFHFPKESER
uniref:DUF4220 domain-containing protein n=4 Tax=Oryza TaxID=4527 RepID=Q53L09_ORYSJ|nr:hypothetical protein [Oryza sativa Japonica Group]AAX96792.1 hypothetical protein LOC_Os11g15510 [Oryza sativa Japonica Group]ABA92455.1 hypothetical protein LOC_Os11g15510 [Oryza sativa Japonica Group]